MFTRGSATVTAAMLFAFFGSVACGAGGHVIFSQPNVPTAVCAEKKGSLAYANPLLTLVAPKTKLKISWGPMLFSKRSKGDHTKPLQNIAYDSPSHSWMIRDRLVPGASWLELAPSSASYQTAP